MPLLKEWVKAKRDREDNTKRRDALSLAALCFTTGTQLPVRCCYIMHITITTTCLHLTFKATNSVTRARNITSHCFSNKQATYVQTIHIAIVASVFVRLELHSLLNRFVSGMNCLRSVGRCDREFESRLGHGYLVCTFILCLCCPVCR
jgi:hypothetical protein